MTDKKPRIDFYVLDAGSADARLHYACRLNEKAFLMNHRVYNHAASPEQAAAFDEMLWTFRQNSFVPHEIDGPEATGLAPVTIGCEEPGEAAADVLVNLADGVPAFFDRFDRVLEIIDGNEKARRLGRERYAFYRDNGYAPQTHRID